MEQEIAHRLSHLTIRRDLDFDPFGQTPSLHSLHSLTTLNENDTDSLITQIYDEDGDGDESLIDAETAPIDVGDAHYHHHAMAAHSVATPNSYKLSLKNEFIRNETFLKYALLYATLYVTSRMALKSALPSVNVNVHSLSSKVVLMSNAIVSVFRGCDLASESRAMLSPFKAMALTESEAKWLDIQKALSVVMLLLSGQSKSGQRRTERVFHALSIGFVLLIKKYQSLGGLYIYMAFWTQITALFANLSRVMRGLGGLKRRRWRWLRKGGVASSVVYALTMIYSRIWLFTKVLVPIVQRLMREGKGMVKPCVGSLASVAFLVSGYYRTGDGIIQTLRSE